MPRMRVDPTPPSVDEGCATRPELSPMLNAAARCRPARSRAAGPATGRSGRSCQRAPACLPGCTWGRRECQGNEGCAHLGTPCRSCPARSPAPARGRPPRRCATPGAAAAAPGSSPAPDQAPPETLALDRLPRACWAAAGPSILAAHCTLLTCCVPWPTESWRPAQLFGKRSRAWHQGQGAARSALTAPRRAAAAKVGRLSLRYAWMGACLQG